MKKNIIAIIGSLNTKSNTHLISKKILSNLNTLDKNYNYEIIILNNYNINLCKGCSDCFRFGKCTYDNSDDMQIIRYKIRKSDIIILASPIYANTVSGITKTIIDRLIFESHTLSFAGKLGFVLTTTQNSGSDFTNDYLKNILYYLGIKCLRTYSISSVQTKDFDENIIEELCKNISNDMYFHLKNNMSYSNLLLEEYFKFYKNLFCGKDHNGYYEEKYWNMDWILKTYSFQEYAKKLISINK